MRKPSGEDVTGHELTDSDAFRARLSALLREHRRDRGIRIRALARRSGGRWSAARLRQVESGKVAEVDAAGLAELYGADLSTILPARTTIEIDAAGSVRAAGVIEPFVPGSDTAVLMAYLRLVRRLRQQEEAPVVALRRDDIEVVAAALNQPGERVVDQLGALMGATQVQRKLMVGLFVSGAAVIGLTVTAVAAATVDIGSVDLPAPSVEVVVGVTATDAARETALADTVPAVDATAADATGEDAAAASAVGSESANVPGPTPGIMFAPQMEAPTPTAPDANDGDAPPQPPAPPVPVAAVPAPPAEVPGGGPSVAVERPPVGAGDPSVAVGPPPVEGGDPSVAVGPPPVPDVSSPLVEPEPEPVHDPDPVPQPHSGDEPDPGDEPIVATGPPPLPPPPTAPIVEMGG